MALVLARYSALRTHEYFKVPKDLTLKVNDVVVLRTRRGTEVGQVKTLPGDPNLGPRDSVAGEVLRRCTSEDSEKFRQARAGDYRHIKRAFRELVAKHRLPMRYELTETLLAGDKTIVYFSSEDRVDFRDFVRDLNEKLNARIELRQVGARDAARLSGDVGVCGFELCCISYIIDFVPVGMKMAKTQRISLDPTKISGQCGRLKCCLKYEDDLYNELRKTMPQEGQPVTCNGAECHACNIDILGQQVNVEFPDGKRQVMPVSEISFEGGWSEKDIRRYRRDRKAKQRAEKEARDAARSAPMSSRVSQPRPAVPEAAIEAPADEPADEPESPPEAPEAPEQDSAQPDAPAS